MSRLEAAVVKDLRSYGAVTSGATFQPRVYSQVKAFLPTKQAAPSNVDSVRTQIMNSHVLSQAFRLGGPIAVQSAEQYV